MKQVLYRWIHITTFFMAFWIVLTNHAPVEWSLHDAIIVTTLLQLMALGIVITGELLLAE